MTYTWIQIPRQDRNQYQHLVDTFIPAVRLKPFDLWTNFHAHHRIAIIQPKTHGSHAIQIQLAVHYLWNVPTLSDLRKLRPGWSSVSIEMWHEKFRRHVREWGFGDIELVTLVLQRLADGIDLDSLDLGEFVVDEIEYRTGAHFRGVLDQARRGEWDKLGNRRVRYKIAEAPFEMMGKRPVLTIDSYHHSFYEPGKAPPETKRWPAILPKSTWFTEKAWKEFQMVEKGRGYEEWEVT